MLKVCWRSANSLSTSYIFTETEGEHKVIEERIVTLIQGTQSLQSRAHTIVIMMIFHFIGAGNQNLGYRSTTILNGYFAELE
jgi:hypothetical protein